MTESGENNGTIALVDVIINLRKCSRHLGGIRSDWSVKPFLIPAPKSSLRSQPTHSIEHQLCSNLGCKPRVLIAPVQENAIVRSADDPSAHQSLKRIIYAICC